MQPSLLSLIADNPALLEELRALIEAQSPELKTVHLQRTNAELGEYARARLEGLAAADRVMREIERHKTVKEKAPRDNPAE